MRGGLLAVVVWLGCYSPRPQPGAPCPDGVCPEGLTCSPIMQTCELTVVDARPVDTPTPIDARPIDGVPTDTPQNAVMLVQQITNYAASGPTLAATLPIAPKAGNVLVMIGANLAGGLTSVTGGGVGSWTLATLSVDNANTEIWFGVTNGTSAMVTITRTTSVSPTWMSVTEWSGLATTNTLDMATAASGSTSPAAAGSITTSGPALVLFSIADQAPTTFGSPTPGTWTALAGTSGAYVQLEWYRIVTTSGTFAPQVTTTNTNWDAAIAALRFVL